MNWTKNANHVAPDTEIVFAKIKNKKKEGSILLGCCYRPPSSDLSYTNSLTNSICSLTQHSPSPTVCIGGDFNLPDIQWEDHQISGQKALPNPSMRHSSQPSKTSA
ncbi:hypothetical protein LSH36_151g00013 [Paralvinella palmiformis]|uniref:Endonuclease/exonuclease/phosphatase domain-containing protein n=1 Tax=Paralvinella palmiformis TaxID=53620 RepID=A0AAD9N8P0_9ANNE|nr:hypothetical protein LSH36_151g00013 [Paralvinella palmiformis]